MTSGIWNRAMNRTCESNRNERPNKPHDALGHSVEPASAKTSQRVSEREDHCSTLAMPCRGGNRTSHLEPHRPCRNLDTNSVRRLFATCRDWNISCRADDV